MGVSLLLLTPLTFLIVRQCQLIRQTIVVEVCWQHCREESSEHVKWVLLCGAPSIREMKSWAVLYSDLIECECSVPMRKLCVNFGMGCGLPVGFRWPTENWCPSGTRLFMCGRGLALSSSPASGPFLWCYIEDFRL